MTKGCEKSDIALYDNNDMNLEEIDDEVFEIDGGLLRELLEEDQESNKDDMDHGDMAESIEEKMNSNPDMMDREQLEKHDECHYSVQDLEWLNMMEPTNLLNYMRVNWFSDGMVDYGYATEECYSQNCDGLVSDEEIYGCLWEDYDI